MIFDCTNEHLLCLWSQSFIIFNDLESFCKFRPHLLNRLISGSISPLDEIKIALISSFEYFVIKDHFIFIIRFNLRKIIHIKLKLKTKYLTDERKPVTMPEISGHNSTFQFIEVSEFQRITIAAPKNHIRMSLEYQKIYLHYFNQFDNKLTYTLSMLDSKILAIFDWHFHQYITLISIKIRCDCQRLNSSLSKSIKYILNTLSYKYSYSGTPQYSWFYTISSLHCHCNMIYLESWGTWNCYQTLRIVRVKYLTCWIIFLYII